MLSFILRHLELVLTIAGLAVIFGVTALATPLNAGPWQVAAVTATLVGVVHGGIFWVVRTRQRNVRAQTLREIQAVLKDIINNELTIIQGMDYVRQLSPEQSRHAEAQIARSVETITDALNHVSEESIRHWRNKYATSHSVRELDRLG